MKEKETIKPDPYEEELFQKIKEEKITVDPVVWSLLNHVLGNRLYSINLILGDFLDTPRWILNVGSYIMIFLYKLCGYRGKLRTIQEVCNRALDNAERINNFLKHLREATQQKPEF